MSYVPQTTFAGGNHPLGILPMPNIDPDSLETKILKAAASGVNRTNVSQRFGITFHRTEVILSDMVERGVLRLDWARNVKSSSRVKTYFAVH